MDSGRSGSPLARALRVGGLALAAAAAFWVGSRLAPSGADGGRDEVVAPVLRPRAGAPVPAPTVTPAGEPWSAAAVANADTDRFSERAVHNPFASLNVSPPAPPIVPGLSEPKPARKPVKAASAPPPLPPPAPVAPPLPFVAVGAIEGAQVTGGQPMAFVRQHDQLLVLRTGDIVGQSYKVDSVTAQRIEFIYLPLMQRQTLALSP
jgi:hypothetical protein